MIELETIAVVIVVFGIIIIFGITGIAIRLNQIEDKIDKLGEK